MKKIILITALLLCAAAVFARGRGQAENAPLSVTVYGLKGPSGVGMARLMDEGLSVPGYEVSFETLSQANLMAARLIAGEAKIGILPPNTASKIYSSGKRLQIAAVTGNGMLSLLTSVPALTNVSQLKGRRAAVAGQGAVPEYVFRKILETNGLSPDSVTLDFSLEYPEIAASLIAGRVETALLPEPFATMARQGNPALHDVIDVQAAWENAVSAGSAASSAAGSAASANYPMTALVVDADFASENPAFMWALLAGYRESIEFTLANPAEAGALAEKHELGLRANIVRDSIPKSNFVFVEAAAARPAIEALFNTFLQYAPSSIGGALPDDGFYYSLPK